MYVKILIFKIDNNILMVNANIIFFNFSKNVIFVFFILFGINVSIPIKFLFQIFLKLINTLKYIEKKLSTSPSFHNFIKVLYFTHLQTYRKSILHILYQTSDTQFQNNFTLCQLSNISEAILLHRRIRGTHLKAVSFYWN